MQRVLTLLIFPLFTFCLITNGQERTDHNEFVINNYTALLSFDPCQNKIKVEDASRYFPGDTVLIIQMQGASIDSTNTSGFGTITSYNNSGNYEFNYINAISGNTIELKNRLSRNYDYLNGRVQLIRVPFYQNFEVFEPLTCLPWNGTIGGVLVFIVSDTLSLYQDPFTDSRGFRGGLSSNINQGAISCAQTDHYADSSSWQFARKGEGIARLNYNKWNGRGKVANGGGGGNGHNSGGAGGGNYGPGGNGGYQLDSCSNAPFANGGIGGTGLNYNNNENRIFLGGGGGAGHMDTNNPAFRAAGGTGGGIIIIKAGYLRSNNRILAANGDRGQYCYSCTNDGTGGGGAGGTILLDIGSYLDSATISVRGGDGSWVLNYANPSERVGPGGGGSGGVIWFTGSTPANARINKNGGASGIIYADSQNPYGATSGADGIILNNLSLIFDTIPFRPNIDSVRIIDSIQKCSNTVEFNGLAYTNTYPVNNWQWFFGDGGSAGSQYIEHTYFSGGTYLVKLVITDSIGCRDSILKSVAIKPPPLIKATKSNDVDCNSPQSQLHATGGGQYSWSPALSLVNPNSADPVASPLVSTLYTVTGIDLDGCVGQDSVYVKVFTGNERFFMPTAFTPNRDGLNDCYGVKYFGNMASFEFSIYNRWGKMVFHATNPSDCWNGKYKGVDQGTGVFVYLVKTLNCLGPVSVKGTFVLIR